MSQPTTGYPAVRSESPWPKRRRCITNHADDPRRIFQEESEKVVAFRIRPIRITGEPTSTTGSPRTPVVFFCWINPMSKVLAHSESSVREAASLSPLMTVNQLAELLQVSTRTIWRMRSSGQLPSPVHVGGNVRWRSVDLENWLASGCKATPSRGANGST